MDQFEWDDAKNASNRLKHGIGFELAWRFNWTSAIIRSDDRFDYGEERALAYGRIDGQGYAFVFVMREERVRIISVRRVHEKEMRKYEHE